MQHSAFLGSVVLAPSRGACPLLAKRCAPLRSAVAAPVRAIWTAVAPKSEAALREEYSGSQLLQDEAPATPQSKPGEADEAYFQQHWSVEYWRKFQLPEELTSEEQPIPSRLQAAARTIGDAANRAGIFASPKAAAYWGYHLSRSSFFLLQGIAGLLAARTSTQITGNRESGQGMKLERLLTAGVAGPVAEATAMFYQDYQNIEEGVYELPWDMVTLNRQWSPLFIARRSAQLMAEASSALGRRSRGKTDEVWLQSPLYPDYYRTFHYQTDGWLSAQSASVYEVSTETLFLGRQDAMQRQALVPLSAFMREQAGRKGAGTRVLELACGTGRFATFIKDNWPEMDVTCLDLSPFYLAKARENMARWGRLRARGLAMGGVDGNGASFLQAPAERIPQPDASFDVVMCVYLFHELPGPVRRAVVAEMMRVLRPGGLCVLNDSIQLGDRPRLDANLGNFESFNEPYYGSYINENFGAMFTEAGFEPGVKVVASASKVLSFRKPRADASYSSAGVADASVQSPTAQVTV